MSTNALAVVHPQFEDPKLLQTIKETVCRGATDAQFRMFIEVCKSTGLNPFLKEVYYVPEKGIIMAARDGYLRVANEHPQFDGMETLVERDERNIPIKATCRVWRKDRNHPTTCEAYFNEYNKSTPVWKQYPSAMISKVAEVLALKRSFSINGVVSEEEAGNAEDRGSKEAQREYLADKGLEPYVAPKGQPPATKPEVIRELSDKLDEPPAIKTLEMRHAANVAEADAQLKDAAKAPKRKPAEKITAESIKIRQHFTELKTLLREESGDDSIYYQTLQANGYQHSKDIEDVNKGREIYRALGIIHKRLTEEKKLRTELELAHMHYGVDFMDLLGSAGCENISDALSLASEPLEALRKAIKELGVKG